MALQPREDDASSSASAGGDTGRGQTFQFVTWFLFVVCVFVVVTRLATKYARTRNLGSDDWTMVGALGATLAQAIAASAAASNGLGQHAVSLSADQIDAVMKALYASVPLFILTCTVVKASVFISINQLSPDAVHRYINFGIAGVVVLWFVSATFLSLFQCSIPGAWDFSDKSKCVNLPAAWTYIAILNMITDFGIVGLFDNIIWSLHVSLQRKSMLLLVFSSRILVVAAIAGQLAMAWEYLPLPDIPYNMWLPTVLNQVVLCTSITTACLPYLRPFMESLHSDILRVDDEGGSDDDLYRSRNNNSSTANATFGTYTMSRVTQGSAATTQGSGSLR